MHNQTVKWRVERSALPFLEIGKSVLILGINAVNVPIYGSNASLKMQFKVFLGDRAQAFSPVDLSFFVLNKMSIKLS